MTKININAEFQETIDLLENTDDHVFLSGRAGTGKSTLLQYFRRHTPKNVVVLAPTGVAAVNVQGQTIHSFFNFKPDITLARVKKIKMRQEQRNLYKKIDTIIIDEVSMVRADLIDYVDAFLRMYGPKIGVPFGGIQMVFIGDLLQLPPVLRNDDKELFLQQYKSPYFFDAQVFKNVELRYLELHTVYRQHDADFINILNAVRTNTLKQHHVDALQARVDPTYQPDDHGLFVFLTTTNAMADRVNQAQLEALDAEPFTCMAEVDGHFDKRAAPTQETLVLKVGAQVMMLNNDSAGRWINGSVGQIVKVIPDLQEPIIRVKLTEGDTVDVTPHTWESFAFSLNEETEEVESEVRGEFRQYPMKLAWAVTIHKAQGKTFDHVIIDLGYGAFAHGQLYVALSRCTSLEGIVLRRRVRRTDVLIDNHVLDFMRQRDDQIPVLS